ncbi:MAG: C-terminal binding protein [Phycisphaerae bacterium]|nr:C-terminal binding protein [Phycisphaerae bacterium]
MPKRAKVVIADFIRDELEPERRILGNLADVVALDATSEDQFGNRIDDADAIMVYHSLSVTRRTIERLTNCKLIIRCGVGFDNIDRTYARSRGIPVANVPDYGTEEVADSAIGMMLTMTRGVHLYNSRLRAAQGPWAHHEAVPLRRLRGSTFAIIGLGRIGTAAALRAKALGMDVLFYDPYVPDGADKALGGLRRFDKLDDMLAEAYVVSLHCCLTDETRRIVDASAMARMPKGSYLVNTARGALVDTDAIPDAIASAQLAGAAIDVLETEPPADDDPLIAAWRDPSHPAHHRVIVNPHSAFYCEAGIMDIRVKASQACRRVLEGLPLRNVVN